MKIYNCNELVCKTTIVLYFFANYISNIVLQNFNTVRLFIAYGKPHQIYKKNVYFYKPVFLFFILFSKYLGNDSSHRLDIKDEFVQNFMRIPKIINSAMENPD